MTKYAFLNYKTNDRIRKILKYLKQQKNKYLECLKYSRKSITKREIFELEIV
jgi:hypothetical protein